MRTVLSSYIQDKFVSREGKSKHQLWQELCMLISKNPNKVTWCDTMGRCVIAVLLLADSQLEGGGHNTWWPKEIHRHDWTTVVLPGRLLHQIRSL